MRHHFETLQFETQEMSSIEALYFAALFRRLLTREQVQQRKTIKTFKDTITKDPKTNYIAPTPDTSPEDTSKTQILNKKGDEPYSSEFAHMSYHNMGHHYSYDNFYPVRGSDAKKRKKEKKNDSDENDDSEEKENRKKDELWKKALLVGTGIVITAGVSWLLWNVLCQKPPDNLTWCWKESSAEDISTWAATAAEEPKEFTLRGAIIGKVEHLGPSTSSLTTSYEAVRQWNAKLVNYVHTSENLAIVRGLNGKLLSILSNTADFRNRNAVSFNPYQPPTSLYAQNFKSTSPSQKGSKEPTVLFIGTNMTLGIAPGDTREGDLICQFWNSNACAVLRRTGFGFQPRYKIVGRAAVVSRDESVDWEVPADKERFIKTGLFRSGIVDLPVSIGMITRLSLDTVNLPSTS
ncbi:hypothetical protein N431DRAFT_427368 [Stipitochalara longipes BDJ]|nr:hypothetical protein N431DRAFT_427368 [Stipitochalara longipes BDJ]